MEGTTEIKNDFVIENGVLVKNGVEKIGKTAFAGCKNFVSVTIPDSTTNISKSAFEGCVSLESA